MNVQAGAKRVKRYRGIKSVISKLHPDERQAKSSIAEELPTNLGTREETNSITIRLPYFPN